MKKLLLISFVVAYLCQSITAQNNAKIGVALQQEMTLREVSELIRVNIILNQRYDQMEMRRKSSVFTKKEDKRSFVVGELKRFSKETQQGVMKLLSTMPAVSQIQSFWIMNFINCYANIEAIKKLSLHPDVLIIGFDRDLDVLPEEKTAHTVEPTRAISYNIQKVNADKVWSLGYEGDGVVVAVLDRGVNYNHYDLKSNMWQHPNFPFHGYNFVDNTNDPMDVHGHGTHVAGTVAGNGTSGVQTGIAPKAKIMAIKIIGGAPNAAWVSGIEFAVEYGAHILNMSCGWRLDDPIFFYDSVDLRDAMVNALEAGVIASVAAGNEGDVLPWYPIPNNVTTPANCPPPWLHPDQVTTGGLSAVVCVGNTDENDNIWYTSSKGPVTWTDPLILGYSDYPYNPGMGLIRPDICAPGVSVTSLSHTNNSGYVGGSYWTGTSMSTPCVAGVMALMLSKNSELTPTEICEILETTAVRLPTSSSLKNNIYGSGRIDAYAAVQAVCVNAFTNKIVTSNTTIIGCNDIYLENVTVTNNAKLTIYATGNVIFGGGFGCTNGATYEIKK